jgi:hypothetical protein
MRHQPTISSRYPLQSVKAAAAIAPRPSRSPARPRPPTITVQSHQHAKRASKSSSSLAARHPASAAGHSACGILRVLNDQREAAVTWASLDAH